ncbi:hypothetical protein D9M73_258150 [compost metagenome]
MKAAHGIKQALRWRTRAKRINNYIDTFPMCDVIGPLLYGTCTQGMNFDAARCGQILNPLKHRFITRRTENLAHAHRQSQRDGTKT